jgi:hypothetical protein
MEREHWLTPHDQSPKVPARYPKATTIKRKDVCVERSERFYSERTSRWLQWKLGARQKWCEIAKAAEGYCHCILYILYWTRTECKNKCVSDLDSRSCFQDGYRENNISQKNPRIWEPTTKGQAFTKSPIHRTPSNPILKFQPPPTPSQSTPTAASPIRRPHPPSSTHP